MSTPLPRAAALAGGGAALLLLGWALLLPGGGRDAAAGWLVGLVFWLGIGLGALVLLALHALTGGRWGEALRPVLAPAAAALPFFLLLALPLLPALRALYPWAAAPDAVAPPDLRHLYLNIPGFVLRAAVALAGWSLAGRLLLRLRPGGAREATAALALVFHLGATTLLGFDWLQSLALPFTSTAFGLAWLLLQVLAALAWAGLFRSASGAANADLAGLLLAAVLASLYLGFVQYLVIWYGDLPAKAAWYLPRQGPGWAGPAVLSVLLAGVVPAAALLSARVRGNPAALAVLGAGILAGLSAHWVWVVAPAVGAGAAAAAVLGLLAVGGLWLGLAWAPMNRRHGRAAP
jgi:hypothetical protein